MTAYYNEFDKFTAQWLRELIMMGVIAPGYVDERSIEDVTPADLRGFTQHHFFAGVGVWSYALRQAGWPDSRPIWTGSCPCQPFSAAGKGDGFNDERHLWPAFAWLIKQYKPAEILGEQVASSATGAWFDLVQTDLERMGYAFGCVPFPAAGVGAPHIRDRAYWAGHLADNSGAGLEGHRGFILGQDSQRWEGAQRHPGPAGMVNGLADTQHNDRRADEPGRGTQGRTSDRGHSSGLIGCSEPGPVNGYWRSADWLSCTDGKWRSVEPGTFPLVNGATSRVGRLRGYGNALNAEAAIAFIKARMLALDAG